LGINLNLGSAKAKTLASDQTALSNAGRTLAETQAKIAAGTLTGLAAQQALANAQDTVSQKQQKLTLDQRSGGAVLDAITAKTKGAANAYGQTLGGQMDVVRAQVHNLSTTFGEDLMPALDKVMKVGVKFLDYLMSHKVILAGIAILVGTVLVAAFIAWGVSVIAATWPILLIIAAIALLAAGVYEVVKHWDTIVDFFKKIWSDVEGVFRGPLGIILAILTPFISLPILIAMHWQQIVAFFESIWSDVVSGVERVISDVYTLFVALPEKLVTGLGDIVATVFGALLAAATWIDTNVLQPLVTYFVGLPVRLVTGLGNIVVTLWTKLLQSVTWIDTNVLQPIVSYFQQLPSRLATGLGDIVGTIFGGLATAWNWINTNGIGPIVTGFEGLPNDIANGIMSALGALSSIAKAILNPIIEGIDTAIDHINSVTGSIPGGGSLHIPDIPTLAAGGIVNSPTLAMIGEAGPEAVVPLGGGGLGGSHGQGDTYNVYVTQSNASPQDIINAIRTYIQRNGSLKNAGIG
jgi:phage-related protein